MRRSILAGVLFVVFSALAAAQPVLEAADVSGLAIHVRCDGERQAGTPLVVLEAGGGFGADTWRDVQGPIAQFARVCAYDRPGRGSSTAPREPLPPTGYVQLLGDVLKAAGEPGPYVLVGHSIGGILAALFANAHPGGVVGLVLVDSSHEAQVRRFAALPRAAPATPPRSLPEPIPVGGLIEELAKKPWRGAIPLVVLTRGRPPPSSGDLHAAARNEIWLELQRDWTTRSPAASGVRCARCAGCVGAVLQVLCTALHTHPRHRT